jgi:hypothetical protein
MSFSLSKRPITAVSLDGTLVAVALSTPCQGDGEITPLAAGGPYLRSWRIALYRNGSLQTTVTSSLSNNSSRLTLAVDGGGSYNEPYYNDDGGIHELLVFVDSRRLAGVSYRDVVVWDLDRGVVEGTVSVAASSSRVTVLDAAAYHHRAPGTIGSLFLLLGEEKGPGRDKSSKSVIQQYQGTKLVRKIKTKHADRLAVVPASSLSSSAATSTDEYWLVAFSRGSSKLRVHSGESGKVVRKITLPGRVVALADLGTKNTKGHGTLLVLLESGAILRVNIEQEGAGSTAIRELGSYARMSDLVNRTAGEPILLEGLGTTTDGSTLVVVDGRDLMMLAGDGAGLSASNDSTRSSTTAPLLDEKTVEAGIVRRRRGGGVAETEIVAVLRRHRDHQVHTRRVSELVASTGASVLMLAWHDADNDHTRSRRDREEPSDSAAPSSKRSKSTSSDPLVLGPAQAGGDARRVRDPSVAALLQDGDGTDDEDDGREGRRPLAKKARKAVMESEEETIASRLAQLRAQLIAEEQEEDEREKVSAGASAEEGTAESTSAGAAATFQPKKATTESLSQLLQQALQDESLLELCLAVTNPTILRESVSNLSRADVNRLVACITSRLAHRPGRADALCGWLQALLQTRKASLEVLQPLHNLIGERVEALPALLKLEGRLSLLSP